VNGASATSSPASRAALAIAGGLAIGFLITLCASSEPLHAFASLLTGPLPELRWSDEAGWQLRRVVRFGLVIEDAITLTFLGLAVAIPFSARQFSLAADGQLFLGALAAAALSLALPAPSWVVLPLAFTVAMLAGVIWGGICGVLKARWGANEIVTTLMMNVVAIQLYRLAVAHWMRDPQAGFIATPVLPAPALLAPWIAHTNVTAMLLIAPLAAAGAWYFLRRTTVGFEIRAVGQAPAFARQLGMPVGRAVVLSMAAGGAFAGLAGVHISHAVLKRLPVDLSPGLGFDGLVVALLARNDPRIVPLAAFLYAWLRVGAQAMERASDVSREMVLVIQAIIILLAVSERLLPAGWRAVGPRRPRRPSGDHEALA
jgi:simple sugar transport system permease protein